MIQDAVAIWQFLCDTVPTLLMAMPESEISLKSVPGKWSKKQVIGHLIDSATNNHQRFVRGHYENIPVIFYDQNKWNEFGYYQKMTGKSIIELWMAYNRYLLALVKNIPEDKLLCEVNTGAKNSLTIAFLINDYVVHLEHHLKQLVNY